MLTIDALEALLFVAGEDGLSATTIVGALGLEQSQLDRLVIELQSICESSSRPYLLVSTKGLLSLVTKPKHSEIIGAVRVEIEKQPLTKSHIEVLSVLIYNGPTAKTDIDAFRGVNSGQALRALSLRGMIEKTGTSHGSSVFGVSPDTLRMLGVADVNELPQYKQLQDKLKALDSKSE